jgi:hypothetical protein
MEERATLSQEATSIAFSGFLYHGEPLSAFG